MNSNFNINTIFHLFFFLGLILGIISCEKDIKIDEKTNVFRTVVNGVFMPQQPWEVHVSKSKELSAPSQQNIIDDAQVKIFKKDTQLVDFLNYDPQTKSYLSTNGYYPEIGEEYNLEVHISGEKKISSSDIVPDTSIVFATNVYETLKTPSFVEFSFSLEDRSIEDGYYQLAFLEKVYGIDSFPRRLLRINPISNLIINDYNDDFDTEPTTSGVKLINSMGYLYDDSDLIGSAPKVIFVRMPLDDLEHAPRRFIVSEISVELRSVSFNYYKFYKDVTEQVNNENPIAFPVSVHNNVIEGIGNFSSYSSVSSVLRM